MAPSLPRAEELPERIGEIPRDGPAADAARAIEAAYLVYRERFREITSRARLRFEWREWHPGQWDAAERLLLYKRAVEDAVVGLQREMEGWSLGADFGTELKRIFAEQTEGWGDAELAGTFYNSVVRRVFSVVGVNAAVEFLDPVREHGLPDAETANCRVYEAERVTPELVARAVRDFRFSAPFRDLPSEAALAAAEIDRYLQSGLGTTAIRRVEMLAAPFYRSKAAYLVGRIHVASEGGDVVVPLLLPLLHGEPGIEIDAVLLSPDDASAVFGFTRSYFHVEVERTRAVVMFLRSIMPHRRIDELYTTIGYHKHGKRELYCELQGLLRDPSSRFEVTAGKKGLVMIVFTLPSFNVVFKVIRDRFGPTKEGSRRHVMERYRLVFLHDRVGRLADAQQFEHFEFRRGCFEPELLQELLDEAGEVTSVADDTVVIEHLYTERRVTPLDIFLREADEEAARAAVIDYGNAIRDLAAANIFPGDMLLKNFGLTRHGRVIFYDYDELRLLTEVNFRRMPEPRDDYDEMSSEPFFHVGENDVFPEEFLPFLLPAGPLRRVFVEHHSDILDVAFWKRMQERQAAHELIDFFPYPAERRLRG
jgi:isocitrate dehydrogenase kinase/phosphatase